ncbi:MAG: ABC transporter permease [Chloroflexi bacterium]|nr:ABC transporter permease [Chloroflexota bacterium]
MRTWALAKRNLREVYRDRVGLGFLLGMPMIFMVIIGLAFGRGGVQPLPVAVVDEDQSPVSSAFVQAIKQVPTLKVTMYQAASDAEAEVKQASKVAFIVLPEGFGDAVVQRQQDGQGKVPLSLGYDATQPGYGPALHSTLTSIAMAFFGVEAPLDIDVRSNIAALKNPTMNWVAPSLIILGLMTLISTTAGRLVRDRQGGFTTRLLTTPVRPLEFVLAYSLPFILVGILSVPIYLVMGRLLGLEILGSLPLAFALYFVSAIVCVGIGMVVASVVRTAEQAEGFAWLIIVPLAAVSGVWFPTEQMPAYMRTFAGIFPFKYAAAASRDVINQAGSWQSVGPDFLVLVGWTVVAFGAGVFLFRRSMAR